MRIENTQVLILDDLLDGPVFDLWTLFASKPVLRMTNMTESTTHTIDNIIIPLPGGSNPFWQGDWEPLSCARSKLLKTFSQRILTFYDIDDKLAADNRPLVLTFIDRREKRRLIDQDRYFARLNSKFQPSKSSLWILHPCRSWSNLRKCAVPTSLSACTAQD